VFLFKAKQALATHDPAKNPSPAIREAVPTSSYSFSALCGINRKGLKTFNTIGNQYEDENRYATTPGGAKKPLFCKKYGTAQMSRLPTTRNASLSVIKNHGLFIGGIPKLKSKILKE
jgi:hypothetical protein